MKRYNLELVCLLFASIFVISSCGTKGEKGISDYYFPLKELTGEGMVYEYRHVSNDSIAPEYWHYQSETTKEGTFLKGTNYNIYKEPGQSIKEEKVSNGMLLSELNLFYPGTLGTPQKFPVEIIAGNTFPFMVSDSSGIFLYKVKWQSPDNPFETTTLIKNRRYTGDMLYTLKGKALKSVRFEVKELFEIDNSRLGGLDPQQYNGLEIYAKGIGLVYYKKQITEDFVLEYELADRFPFEDFK